MARTVTDPTRSTQVAMLEALPQAAALVDVGGQILAANVHWHSRLAGSEVAAQLQKIFASAASPPKTWRMDLNEGFRVDLRFAPLGGEGAAGLVTAEIASDAPMWPALLNVSGLALAAVDKCGVLSATNDEAARLLGPAGSTVQPLARADDTCDPVAAALTAARRGETVEFLAKDPQVEARVYRHELVPDVGHSGYVLWSARDVSLELLQAKSLGALQKRLDQALRSETLLARELHHRVRNLFSVITGLISASQRVPPEEEGAQATLERLKLRIAAMGRAADLLMPSSDSEKPLLNPDPAALSTAVLQPFDGLFRVSGMGPEVSTPMLSTIVLVLHEMATNSLEHGVLREKSGLIDLNWRDEGSHSRLVWDEACASGATRAGVEGRGLLRSLILASASEMQLCDQATGLRAEFRFRNDWVS